MQVSYAGWVGLGSASWRLVGALAAVDSRKSLLQGRPSSRNIHFRILRYFTTRRGRKTRPISDAIHSELHGETSHILYALPRGNEILPQNYPP